MQIIGEIENISSNGLWIIRSDHAPDIGSKVYDQHKHLVGRIINIIGPVKKPYILVRPKLNEKQKQLQIIGEKMYIKKEIDSKKMKHKR